MTKARFSIVLANAIERPGYCPYCSRCTSLVRMRQVGHMHWRCSCGAEHDERARSAILRAYQTTVLRTVWLGTEKMS